MQIQQMAAMKMQEYVMKNGGPPQMTMNKPPPEQQKMMQLQILAHLKGQFATQPELSQ